MLADEVDYVIGVDTHRDHHTLAVIVAPAGAVLAQTVVDANTRGYGASLRFVDKHAPGVRAWALEGAGHHGAGLARYLAERGETCSRSAARAGASGGCAARTTRSTRSALPARGSRPRR
jgi:hypothetical protein